MSRICPRPGLSQASAVSAGTPDPVIRVSAAGFGLTTTIPGQYAFRRLNFAAAGPGWFLGAAGGPVGLWCPEGCPSPAWFGCCQGVVGS